MPEVSIILPVWNEATAIGDTLGALQSARRDGAEVIVVDGGSLDATAVLARPLADRVIAAPRGRASQMNAGARLAAAPHLLFLHADTVLPSGALDAVRHALEQRWWGRFDVVIAGADALLPVVASCMNARSRLTGVATGDQAIFMRREAFEAVGGFPA